MFARVAWRNLGRRKLRTWLSAGAIAFAVLLVSVFMALQSGIYGGWIETATGLMSGHLQLQHPDYLEDPKVANAMPHGTELARIVAAVPLLWEWHRASRHSRWYPWANAATARW